MSYKPEIPPTESDMKEWKAQVFYRGVHRYTRETIPRSNHGRFGVSTDPIRAVNEDEAKQKARMRFMDLPNYQTAKYISNIRVEQVNGDG